jgi:GMP synthase-like glutamine amidotransferase
MNVHYFQHVSFESPGYILNWLTEKGHTVTATKFYEQDFSLPDLSSIDALIVMGGPMGVYDEHLYPWLRKEKGFIEDAIHAGKKVLGICLGGQLIATCLGAYVNTAPQKEIGWFSVYATNEITHTVSVAQ